MESLTLDNGGAILAVTVDGITMPESSTFESVNDFVHRADTTYEELEALCLRMASEIDRLMQLRN